MKLSMLFLATTAAGLLVPRQANLPPCVQTCLTTAVANSPCTASDLNCLCTTQSFVDQAGQCYSAQCSPADAQAGLAFGTQACEEVGISVTFSGSPSATAASASSTRPISATSPVSSSRSSASSTPSSAPKDSPAQAVTVHRLALPLVAVGVVMAAL